MQYPTGSTLPLLNCHGQKQHIFKNICIRKKFCAMLYSTLHDSSVDSVVFTKVLLTLIYIHTHTYIHQHMYVYAPAMEATVPTVLTVYGPA